jgi:hypothetical protein
MEPGEDRASMMKNRFQTIVSLARPDEKSPDKALSGFVNRRFR